MLTINRASAADLGCLQQRTAFFTGLAASAVYQQMILVIALISFAILIITEGCAAIFDALRDYRIDCLTQAPYLSSTQAAGFAHRQNAGQSQTFIGINIAKAGNNLLIQNKAFDSLLAFLRQRQQISGSKALAQRLRSQRFVAFNIWLPDTAYRRYGYP